MPPPPPLMDELVEEILLRLPPASPASLVRAGVVCKRWCHLISDPGFQRRFREHHRSPPILGFLHVNTRVDHDNDNTYTTSFVPKPTSGLRRVDHPSLLPRECRHGRVLLYYNHSYDTAIMVVWDPITGERVQLPNPPPPSLYENKWTAAGLCAAAAAPGGSCDHLDCHGGPFIVVLVVQHIVQPQQISSYVYSSESGAWSEPTFSPPHSGGGDWIHWMHSSQLVGNELYFMSVLHNYTFAILQYDLGTREITAINPPKAAHMDDGIVELIATKDGRLGFVSVEDTTKLSLWSREVVGDGTWALCQVIDLEKLFPEASSPDLFGSAEDTGVIFLRVQGSRLVSIDLWSGLVTELDGRELPSYHLIVPYMAFITPVLSRPTDGGPRESGSAHLGMSATCSK